ncbi:PAS domain S-box-containing protein [Pedobacter sp. CAN_A7]|uniref:PAS domain S-box protein n=1 Tax=Pedobacter sp. CAN_A7 TaxID=2787722 RepID=UPI0018C8F8E9
MLSIESLKSVFETSAVGCLIIYPDAPRFTIAYANEAYLNILNTHLPDILGKSVIASADPDFVNKLTYILQHQKAADESCYPILDDKGQVAFIVTSVQQDHLVPQKQTTAIFDDQSANILESITDAFFAVDQHWCVTYWNKEAEKVMQMPRHGIIGKNLWELFPDAVNLAYYKEYHMAMLEKIPRHFEIYYPIYAIWMEVSVYPSNNGISVFFKDIGHRVEAEKQLKEAKQNYKNLFNLSPLPMCVYDMDTLRYLDVNEAAIVHYGYSHEEFMNMTLNDIRPNTGFDELAYILKNEVIPGEIHTKITTHQKKNGELIMVETRGNCIEFGDHKARLVAKIDVTKTIAAEEAVKRSEQYFKALIQSGSELIAIIDAEGHYSYINSSTNSILGIDPESYLGKSPFKFIHPDDIPTVKEQMELIATKKRIKVSPFRFCTSDQEYRWLEAVVTDMRDDPAVGGLVTNSRDVTRRIEYEIKLKESINRFNLVSKATSDAIFDFDAQLDVLYWGDGFRENFGHTPGESLQYSDWATKIHPEEKERVLAEHDLCKQNKEKRLDTKYRFRCADGTYKVVLQKCSLIYDEDGTLLRMLGSLQNITETVNYIKAIEAQNILLNEISWTQSHIVRAPLARLIGLLALVHTEELGSANHEVFTHIQLSAAELDQVTTEIIKKTEALDKA